MSDACCCRALGQAGFASSARPQANGFALFQRHFRVTLDVEASQETLAVAWEQLQVQHAAADLPLPADLVWQSPPHHATLAFLCEQWRYHGGQTSFTAAELVKQTKTTKLIPEVRLLLVIMGRVNM